MFLTNVCIEADLVFVPAITLIAGIWLCISAHVFTMDFQIVVQREHFRTR